MKHVLPAAVAAARLACEFVTGTRAARRLVVVLLASPALVLGAALPASAPVAGVPAETAASAATQHVEVSERAAQALRREASASKTSVSREDLSRYGDSNLADALQRVPDLSIRHEPGKPAEVRLRGLGSGYTQILIDGEPVATGFSIESISPEAIERVEILRSPTADMSAQAIAGTINIVLRHANVAPSDVAKFAYSRYDRAGSVLGSYDLKRHSGDLSYGVTFNGNLTRDRWPLSSDTRTLAKPDGTPSDYETRTSSSARQVVLGVAPQIDFNAGADRVLSLTALLTHTQMRYAYADERATLAGVDPEFMDDHLVSAQHIDQLRSTLSWHSPLGSDARIETKLTGSLLQRTSDGELIGSDRQQEILYRTVHSVLNDGSLATSGKASLGVGDDHTLAAGWDGQGVRRKESRLQHDSTSGDLLPEDLDERFDSTIDRVALFAQDEWTASRQFSAYAGLRWEGIDTRTRGVDLPAVRTHSSVFSPMFQAIWRIPSSKSDQVRLNIARTYKAPTAADLIPRRWISTVNSSTTPDFEGNPALLPELAWGADLAYERYLASGATMSLNAYARRIDRVILHTVSDVDGTWIESPSNVGSATVEGLGLQVEGKLAQWLGDAPDVSLRASATRNWSRLDAVPGPGNRLDRQPSLVASLGADWRLVALPMTLGSTFSFEAGGQYRTSVERTLVAAPKRTLDLYGVWSIDKRSHLRLSATNVLSQVAHSAVAYASTDVTEQESVRTSGFLKLSLQWELTL